MLYRRGNNIWRKLLWEIDVPILISILVLILCGVMLISTASPPVAERVKLRTFHFVYKHILFVAISLVCLAVFMLIQEAKLKRICFYGLICTMLCMALVLVFGDEAKGAKRWISMAGLTIQPSEFAKPFLSVVIGNLLAEKRLNQDFPGFTLSTGFFLAIVAMLLLQPDFGMTVSMTIATMGQFFIAGISIILIIIMFVFSIIGSICAYYFFPHVAKRVNSFLYGSDQNSNYQVTKSLEAYLNGGLFGRGPGEGAIKSSLPDCHTDFIFAVAGEEFGACFAVFVILLFMFITVRGLLKFTKEYNLFHMYASIGILLHFSFQAIFNIGVTLNLFPTKGMTLPFISYGGSSMISFAIGMGIYINLCKKRYGHAHRLQF